MVAPVCGGRSPDCQMTSGPCSLRRTGGTGEMTWSAGNWRAEAGMFTHRFKVGAPGCRRTLSSLVSDVSQPGFLLGKDLLVIINSVSVLVKITPGKNMK